MHRLGSLASDTRDTTIRALARATPAGDDTDVTDPTADPEAAAMACAAVAALRDAVASLDKRRRLVVELRYGLADDSERSNREVARLLGVSEFTVEPTSLEHTAYCALDSATPDPRTTRVFIAGDGFEPRHPRRQSFVSERRCVVSHSASSATVDAASLASARTKAANSEARSGNT